MTARLDEQHLLYSQFLKADLAFIIHYPPHYEPTHKYPYLIVQDGQDFITYGDLFTKSDAAMLAGTLHSYITIAIPYESVALRAERCHPNGASFSNYQRCVAEELTPYLDATLPSLQMAQGRYLAGVSLGATFSLALCLRYRFTFGKVCLFSPFLDETLLEKCRTTTPVSLVISHTYGTDEQHVDTTFGEPDCDFTTPNQQLAIIWSEQTDYTGWPFNGTHLWRHWSDQLAQSLQVFNEKEF